MRQEASRRRDPEAIPTRCGEPDFFQFSGAATLIRPCSQAGGKPYSTLFLGLKEPDAALFGGPG